ncbi:cupin domain-containing protein [Ignatzschineria indica]|uniref:cupin domain-containing protein n=1 Tax=Ignatzschineria indica TaxID=472583 RepID=UPI002574B853|nr:cupin domain-containing protein [Ignatzschineria indica]MDM1545174.1 cupin domain-containing protein [Ignatzschineria indica]
MIRCVRMWTGEDGNSHFEEGTLVMKEGERGDFIGLPIAVNQLSFRETTSGGSFDWHKDPVPRFVITLSGTLEFEMALGETFQIKPGDILLAQDNTGTGHKWRLVDDEPWRRAYVVYDEKSDLTFKPLSNQ